MISTRAEGIFLPEEMRKPIQACTYANTSVLVFINYGVNINEYFR